MYPHEKLKLKLKPDAVPVHKIAYPVLFKRQPVFNKELEHLVREKKLRKCGATTWALSMFITQKKADKDRNNRI